MRLIDADKVLEEWDERTDDHRITDSEFHRMINEDLPLIELGWHYPSKGEYPPEELYVLCELLDGTHEVGKYCPTKYEEYQEYEPPWEFGTYLEEHIKCWQYIVPPEEKA